MPNREDWQILQPILETSKHENLTSKTIALFIILIKPFNDDCIPVGKLDRVDGLDENEAIAEVELELDISIQQRDGQIVTETVLRLNMNIYL